MEQKKCNEYVGIYLDVMFQPVVEATQDIDILNLLMKIICESCLEHIYHKQIKFHVCGALNLLKDFEGIAEWIESNKQIPEAYREKLMKHEVLRYCEGVGKILLREPDEIISMFPSPTKAKRMSSSNADEGNKRNEKEIHRAGIQTFRLPFFLHRAPTSPIRIPFHFLQSHKMLLKIS